MRDDLDVKSALPSSLKVRAASLAVAASLRRRAERFPTLVVDDRGEIVAGTVSGAAFLLLVFALAMPLWLVVPLAGVTYVAVLLVWPRPSRGAGAGVAAPILTPNDTADIPDQLLPARDEVVAPTTPSHPALNAVPVLPPDSDELWQAFARAYGLTKRELEVVPLLARRLTDREIAERLFLSPKTAMNHAASVLGKLGLKSRREVAALLKARGLVVHDDDAPAA